MSLHEELDGIPVGADVGGAGMLNRIDVRDKYVRNKGLNFKEEAEFRGICKFGANQLIKCYGQTGYEDYGEEYSRRDFLIMCKDCPYYLGRESGDCNTYTIADPYFIDYELCEFLDYQNKLPEYFIYFVADGEYVKIGVSNNVKQRMTELQVSNARKLELIALVPARGRQEAYTLEEKLHWCYRNYLVRGEWYNILKIIDVEKFKEHFSPDDYKIF